MDTPLKTNRGASKQRKDMDDLLQAPITPKSERTVSFRGKSLKVADLLDKQGYVAFYSLCDAFGLNQRAQRKRLERRNNFYAPYLATIIMSSAGGPQATLCLMAAAVPLFLSGVQIERVSDPESAELLRAFQEEAMDVLAEHFGISERGELAFLRQAVARMVAEQEAYDQKLEDHEKKVEAELAAIRAAHDDKVQQIRTAFSDLRGVIREAAGPKQLLTPEQLGQLRETVNLLGHLMQERGDLNPYQGIYFGIFKLTGIARSEHITQAQFPAMLEYLDQQIDIIRSLPPVQSEASQTDLSDESDEEGDV